MAPSGLMQDHRSHGCRVLITGASGGIGAALARELGRSGARLLLCARREPALRELETALRATGADCCVMPLDITLASARRQLADWIGKEWKALDILVNNAGVGAVGPFQEASPDRLAAVMALNFVAPAELARTMLPWLQRGSRPVIVNMGSVLGHCAVPFKSEYCASKFALRGFSNALRMELRAAGVHVLLVSPSTTATDFFEHLLEGAGPAQNRWPAMTSEYVARRTLQAIRRRQRELFLPWGARAVLQLAAWFPGCFETVLSWRLRHAAQRTDP